MKKHQTASDNTPIKIYINEIKIYSCLKLRQDIYYYKLKIQN